MEASPPPAPSPPLPPPPSSIPDIPTARIERYKIAWRVFMIANLGLGAYIFARAKMKSSSLKTEKPPLKSPPPTSTPPPTVESLEEPEIAPSTPIADLVKVREPVPEEHQRELFKWMLDEKRKIKPRNKDDKRRIDEEKAILKKFIRAETVPSL
ncbi:uncharacterized protein LOC141605739 [Silene latifolia]|uniref:uncharacterized protein LOC141605739 n=1 Tax=Silene latifolia TaxID=37657 RepID=UPI003D7812E2